MNKNDINNIWKNVIKLLEPSFVNKKIFEECVSNTFVSHIVNDNVYVIVKSIFAKSILVNDYLSSIEDIITNKLNAKLNILFILEEEKQISKLENSSEVLNTTSENNNLIKEYTLDNFIVGEFNKSAYNAICAISNKLGSLYNPLFIYGSTGLGKTHLISGLGNLYFSKYKNKNIRYIESDVFIRDVFNAISKGSGFIEQLKDDYNNIDLLLIDDIQFLMNKDKTNEIFFNIFNTLVKNGKQIIITSDKHPNKLGGLDERMISRFNSGLTLKIGTPEADALKRIVLQKINQNESSNIFNDDAIHELVKYYNNDLRKLIGSLNQISFHAIQYLEPNALITADFIKTFINENNTYVLNNEAKLNPDIIISTICKWYGVKEDQVKGSSRLKNLSNVRHICMYVLRNKCDLNLNQIGALFSNRDHTTVMNAIEKIKKLIEKDEQLKKFINDSIEK